MERSQRMLINPIALRKTKIVYNFGLSGCNRVNKLWPSKVKICSGFRVHLFQRRSKTCPLEKEKKDVRKCVLKKKKKTPRLQICPDI